MFARKQAFRSRRAAVKQQRTRIIASGISAALLVLIGTGIWYGTRLPAVTIDTIEVSGGSTVPPTLVAEKVEAQLEGTFLLLVPRRFSFLYPKEDIERAVEAIPRVRTATVVPTTRNHLSVTFEEYVPYALWCDVIASSTSSCLFVDPEGYAYAKAPPLQGETLVRLVAAERTPALGVYVYGEEVLAQYRLLSDAIYREHAHRVRAITETNERDITLHLSGDVDLLITKDTSVQSIFETIESLFASPEWAGRSLDSFEYIDARFGNKVYVKRKGVGDESPQEAVEVE